MVKMKMKMLSKKFFQKFYLLKIQKNEYILINKFIIRVNKRNNRYLLSNQ